MRKVQPSTVEIIQEKRMGVLFKNPTTSGEILNSTILHSGQTLVTSDMDLGRLSFNLREKSAFNIKELREERGKGGCG